MVLLLCSNYSNGKEEGCLYLGLLESFTLNSLGFKLDVCYRKKEISYFRYYKPTASVLIVSMSFMHF